LNKLGVTAEQLEAANAKLEAEALAAEKATQN
jgi:hypothetical protein